MRSITRLPEPEVLTEHHDEWKQKFLDERAKKPGARPSSKQYAHDEVVRVLQAMSAHKCFYCEASTKAEGHEVDHYHPVAERPDLAFAWENLYLACRGCNDKLAAIPADECLDPCDPADHPEEHLTFDDEFIRPRNDSQRGRQTICKYRLDRKELDHRRVRRLYEFARAQDVIKSRMIAESRKQMTPEEREILLAFGRPEHPFSLMFQVLLRGLAPAA